MAEKSFLELSFLCCFTIMLLRSQGLPTDEPHRGGTLVLTNSTSEEYLIAETEAQTVNLTYSSNRGLHSRMMIKNSTLGYEEWWYLTTTKRPFISARDFPGRVGVASWKEISANKDARGGRDIKASTGEQRSHASQITAPVLYKSPFFSVLLYLILCFSFAGRKNVMSCNLH